MLIVENVLRGEDLTRVKAALAGATFVDGRATASGFARAVKQNHEAPQGDPALREIRHFLQRTLAANGQVASYSQPVRWAEIVLSRYGEGEAYGEHVDAPFMRAEGGAEMRADLSFTLFLDDPESYEGGELVLDSHRDPRPVKLPAGAAVIYPTTVLHRVAPVRSGLRHAAVGWIESRIQSAEQRTLLYELEQAVVMLPHEVPRRRLTLVFASLLKMWS